MKTIVVALLLVLTCAMARADANMDRQSYCSTYGAMLQSIAAWRDQGSSQENTLKLMVGVKGISLQEKKDSINAVYTRKEFEGARGADFGLQMHRRCLQK